MKIAYIYADSPTEWNCSEWRMLAPSDAINRAAETNPKYEGWTAKLIHVSGFTNYLDSVIQDYIMPTDIVIVQRNVIIPQVIDAMRYYQAMGKPVAVDLDDAYQILPWSNPAHKFWKQNAANFAEHPLGVLERGLQQSNGFIAPNRLLLQSWAYAVKGFYLPNFARKFWWSDLPSRSELRAEHPFLSKHQDAIVIGWGGSVSHYDSWWGSGIREAATEIARLFPNVIFMLCGNDPRLYQQLPVPAHQKYHQEGVPPEKWPSIVKLFDIGVAPLSGMYDQYRSWIKGLEYGLAGVPWIATRGEPYKDLLGLGYQIPNGASPWLTVMKRVIENLPQEQGRAQSRVPRFENFYVENQIDTLEKVYKEIIQQFAIQHGSIPNVYRVNMPIDDFRALETRDSVIAL